MDTKLNGYPDTYADAQRHANFHAYRDADPHSLIDYHHDADGRVHTHLPGAPAHDHFHPAADADMLAARSLPGRRWTGAPEIEVIIMNTALAVIALCIGIAIGLAL